MARRRILLRRFGLRRDSSASAHELGGRDRDAEIGDLPHAVPLPIHNEPDTDTAAPFEDLDLLAKPDGARRDLAAGRVAEDREPADLGGEPDLLVIGANGRDHALREYALVAHVDRFDPIVEACEERYADELLGVRPPLEPVGDLGAFEATDLRRGDDFALLRRPVVQSAALLNHVVPEGAARDDVVPLAAHSARVRGGLRESEVARSLCSRTHARHDAANVDDGRVPDRDADRDRHLLAFGREWV